LFIPYSLETGNGTIAFVVNNNKALGAYGQTLLKKYLEPVCIAEGEGNLHSYVSVPTHKLPSILPAFRMKAYEESN